MGAAAKLALGAAALGAGGALAWALLRRPLSAPAAGVPSANQLGFDFAQVFALVAWYGERSSGYGTLNRDDAGQGASWGAVQFNQGAGSLGLVLLRWSELDPEGFSTYWMGDDGTDYGAMLIDVLNAPSRPRRLSLPLGGVLADKLIAAGELEAARLAQYQVAFEEYLEPLLPLLAQLPGGASQVAATFIFDRSINNGIGRAGQCLTYAIGEGHRDQGAALRSFLGCYRGIAGLEARLDRIAGALESAGYDV